MIAAPSEQALDPNVTMLGKIPMQQSLMEVLAAPFMRLLGFQMGWGTDVPFHMFTATNAWLTHWEYYQTGEADKAFRAKSRYLVVAEVEAVDGRVQTASLHYYEGLFHGTVRTAELFIGLSATAAPRTPIHLLNAVFAPPASTPRLPSRMLSHLVLQPLLTLGMPNATDG